MTLREKLTMDYDKTSIPTAYDAGRGYDPAVLDRWLDVISQSVPKGTISEIVDVGCGTGRYSAALGSHLNAHVVAIDPSEKMLAEARKKAPQRVRHERASAESLPLQDASVDLAFMSMVFHHFDDPDRAVSECRRVLRRGGTVCVRETTADYIETYPYVPFFSRSRCILNDVLPSQEFIKSIFTRAGFQLVRHDLVRSEAAESWAAYARKLGYRAISILAQLSDQEFEDGLSVLREHAATVPTREPVIELMDFFVFSST
jgi:ubiquinone/menaquinone biosynthesis C-methylase UbiE